MHDQDIFGGNEEKILDMIDAIQTWAGSQQPSHGDGLAAVGDDDTTREKIEDDDWTRSATALASVNQVDQALQHTLFEPGAEPE